MKIVPTKEQLGTAKSVQKNLQIDLKRAFYRLPIPKTLTRLSGPPGIFQA